MTTLYALNFSDDTESIIHIFEGIHEKHSTNSNIVYPAVKHLGTVNITHRRFYKAKKLPKKVNSYEGNILTLLGYDIQCKELSILLGELGYDQTMLTDITNVVLTKSSDKTIKIYEQWRYNEYGSMDGIVPF